MMAKQNTRVVDLSCFQMADGRVNVIGTTATT